MLVGAKARYVQHRKWNSCTVQLNIRRRWGWVGKPMRADPVCFKATGLGHRLHFGWQYEKCHHLNFYFIREDQYRGFDPNKTIDTVSSVISVNNLEVGPQKWH